MINVQRLSYTYGPERTIQFPDFSVGRGEQYLLLGESGSGKTTLLHLLGGLLRVRQGTIVINGTDITSLSERAMDRFRGRNMGFVFQKNHLIRSLSVKKNLLMAPFLAGLPQDEERVDEVLEQLGLAGRGHSRIDELSQGQVQRIAIARAILNRPAVIFADEPTSALDDKNCDRVITLLLEVAAKNQSTLVVATHDQRLKSVIGKQINLRS